MNEEFNGFSTLDLVEMKRDADERKEKKELQKENERLYKGLKLLQKQNREKQKIIYNAKEYIKYHCCKTYSDEIEWNLSYLATKELYDILKGVDKE